MLEEINMNINSEKNIILKKSNSSLLDEEKENESVNNSFPSFSPLV